jgi:hypothetical protein
VPGGSERLASKKMDLPRATRPSRGPAEGEATSEDEVAIALSGRLLRPLTFIAAPAATVARAAATMPLWSSIVSN